MIQSADRLAALLDEQRACIERIIAILDKKAAGGNFSLSEYKDSTGRSLPMYQLSKTECLYVATKFNDEARARLAVVQSGEFSNGVLNGKYDKRNTIRAVANIV